MSAMTIKSFVQQSIDKYLEKRQNLCKDFTSSKIERIKNTISKMVMECLETSLPLSIKADPEIYVELTVSPRIPLVEILMITNQGY